MLAVLQCTRLFYTVCRPHTTASSGFQTELGLDWVCCSLACALSSSRKHGMLMAFALVQQCIVQLANLNSFADQSSSSSMLQNLKLALTQSSHACHAPGAWSLALELCTTVTSMFCFSSACVTNMQCVCLIQCSCQPTITIFSLTASSPT